MEKRGTNLFLSSYALTPGTAAHIYIYIQGARRLPSAYISDKISPETRPTVSACPGSASFSAFSTADRPSGTRSKPPFRPRERLSPFSLS